MKKYNLMVMLENLGDMLKELDLEKNDSETIKEVLKYISFELLDIVKKI